jgi:hypothetical protein
MATKRKTVTVEEIYNSGHEAGMDRDEVIIQMHTELGLSLNKASAEFKRIAKEQGHSSAVATGFRAELYEKLKAGVLGEQEFLDMVEKASPNTKRHVKHFDAIRVLTNSVWESK